MDNKYIYDMTRNVYTEMHKAIHEIFYCKGYHYEQAQANSAFITAYVMKLLADEIQNQAIRDDLTENIFRE
ncbi:MAG: hypothetical protein J6S67_00045 [Methanobrevibacter sp.]|nr:hypothetical protein [Methanobrevibacter sp.]